MAGYKPTVPFTVPFRLLIPSYSRTAGVPTKTFPSPANGILFFGSFRTFGGTERTSNDVYTIENTAVIDTWYRPDIKADCQIYVLDTEEIYDIISDPENIDRRNQYLRFKVKKTGGKP